MRNIVWCFDLELNQPSNKIIQIGLLFGDLDTGEVKESINYYIDPKEPISPFITDLTGITDSTIREQSKSILEAFTGLKQAFKKHTPHKSPITWGGGDLRALKQLAEGYYSTTPDDYPKWLKVHRELDLKTLVQFICLSKPNLTLKGGLGASMQKFGLTFEGAEHRAHIDAYNTFMFAHYLHNKLGRFTL